MENVNLQDEINACNEFVFNLNKALVEQFCIEAGVKEPVGFYNDQTNKIMTIYSNKCGYLIGYKGNNVNLFIERLNEAFYTDGYRVEFVDIKGGIVNYNK